MPLIVECVGEWGLGKIYSLAHYSEQNRDLMADPEMTFLLGAGGLVFPLTYRNDFRRCRPSRRKPERDRQWRAVQCSATG